MTSVTFTQYTRDALFISLDQVVRSGSFSVTLSLKKFCEAVLGMCETRISNVSRGSLNLVGQVAVQQLWNLFASACISDNWTCTPTSRDQIGECTLFLGQTLVELAFWQLVRHLGEAATQPMWYFQKRRRVLPRDCLDVSKRFSTPSLCQWSALCCTHFKNFIVDTDTMECAPTTTKSLPPPRTTFMSLDRCLRHQSRSPNSRHSLWTCLSNSLS